MRTKNKIGRRYAVKKWENENCLFQRVPLMIDARRCSKKVISMKGSGGGPNRNLKRMAEN